MQAYDVIIIGAGHNGLTCPAYFGRAGLKVKVVERRPVVGGAAVTEELHPGFRNSVAAYTVSLLNPKVVRDLALEAHGLRIVERRAQNFLPAPDSSYLLTGEGRTKREIAKFSRADAERYDAFAREIERIADVLRALVKALFGFDAVVGNYASPFTPGTAYVLLHHAFGEVNGQKGVWGHAVGGMGAITAAMARAANSA